MNQYLEKSLILATLSIVIAEILSTSTPIWNLLNPINFLVLLGLYGSGVLLIRSIAIERKWSYLGILLLGLAYGIIEEGLAVKTFFEPKPDIVFGRIYGVNLHWAIYITLYHSVWSILTPIALAETIYSKDSGKPWIKTSYRKILYITLTTTVLLFNLFATKYTLEIKYYIICIIVIVVTILLANFMGSKTKKIITPKSYSRQWTAWSIIWIILAFILPHIIHKPAITIILALPLTYWAISLSSKIRSNPFFTRLKAALVYGTIRGSTILILLLLLTKRELHSFLALPIAIVIALYARHRMKQ